MPDTCDVTFTDYQQRVYDERQELNSKRQSLCDFMHSDAYVSLEAVEQGLLMVQLVAMDNYLSALDRQLELFGYVAPA